MKVGIVGLGYWGRNYIRVVSRSRRADLVAMCDTRADLAESARRIAPSARVTCDPRAVTQAADVDAVVIATPASTHYELVRQALEAEKHVLCEKPLTMTGDQCETLISAAASVERTLFVGHTFVYNAAVRALRELVADAELGSNLYAQAVWSAPGPVREDVNALWDLAPHPISVLSYVLGRVPSSVAATGQTILDPGREDIASLHLRFDERASADVHLSWIAPRKVRSVMITGSRKIALFDDMQPTDKLHIFDTASLRANGAHPAGEVPERTVALPDVPAHIPDLPPVEPLVAQLDHFLECCRMGRTPESDGMAGTSVVRVLEAAQLSLEEQGQPITLRPAWAMR